MARRRALGCLLAIFALGTTACKGKDGAAKTGGDLGVRCEQLGKACGDNDKHAQKIVDECKQAALKQASCAVKVTGLYDCFEKEVCGKGDKVWALDDMGVLADRNTKCVAEREAVKECAAK